MKVLDHIWTRTIVLGQMWCYVGDRQQVVHAVASIPGGASLHQQRASRVMGSTARIPGACIPRRWRSPGFVGAPAASTRAEFTPNAMDLQQLVPPEFVGAVGYFDWSTTKQLRFGFMRGHFVRFPIDGHGIDNFQLQVFHR